MSHADTNTHLTNAMECGRKGDLAGAERHLRALLAIQPDYFPACWQLGLVLAQQGALTDAETALRSAVKLDAGHAQAHCDLGVVLRSLGQLQEAEHCFRQSVRLAPNTLAPHIHLGSLLLDTGNPVAAQQVLEQAVGIDDRNPWAHYYLGLALEQTGRIDEAISTLERAVACDATQFAPHVALGKLWVNKGESGPAVAHFKRWVELAPDSPEALCELGSVHLSRWEFTEADRCYNAAMKLAPGHPIPVSGKVGVLERQRKFEEAWALITPYIKQDAVSPELVGGYAALSHRFGKARHACELIEKVVEKPGTLSDSAQRFLHHQAGDLYDRLEEYDKAFDHYRRGNELNPDRSASPEGLEKLVDGLIATFDLRQLPQITQAGNNDNLPVFILGMPRSGTTLMEQIIASHPNAHGAGELWQMTQLVNRLPQTLGAPAYPECMVKADRKNMDRLANGYLDVLHEKGGDALRVTDKMPHNFMHLGVIDRLFPGARVIHCVRNPVDTCLSCYIQAFSGSGYTSDLKQLGHYYRQYQRLMAHWKSVLNIPILDVQYEELIADQEGWTRKVIDFIGLEWDDATLDFHRTKRKVATASYNQVTRPIYTRSVARWRHYQRHLGPLFEALGIDPDGQEDPR